MYVPNRIHEDTPLYRSTEGLAVLKFGFSLQAEVLMKSPCIETQLLFVIYIGGVDEGELYIVMCIIGYMLTPVYGGPASLKIWISFHGLGLNQTSKY